jgi:membrane protease YdiL (CAAX protease family)
VVVLLFLAVACRAANRASATGLRIAAHGLLLLICAGLMLHVLPGFENPQVISGVVLGPGAEPYTKYLNFDKAVAGLFLLGIYAPQLPARDALHRHLAGVAWRGAVLVVAVIALALAIGFTRLDPKLPPWFALWGWSMVFLTALPEEALFRGVVQTNLAPRLGPRAAIAVAAALFGLAHVAGGWSYVALAAVAGAGYGWIYAATRSIAGAILAHAGLNTIHLLFFTYPALAR